MEKVYGDPSHIKTILSSKDRTVAGPTAPAEGLYLEKIDYPKELLDDNWPIIYDANSKIDLKG